MGDTSIEWTRNPDGSAGKTWNPLRGCSRTSPGCERCYAEKIAARFSDAGQPFHGYATRGPARWTRKVSLLNEVLDTPMRWRKPTRVFANSMSDMFHESLSNESIAAVFGVMAACPQHTFHVLTKRATRMREWFEWVDRHATLIAPADPDNPWWRVRLCVQHAPFAGMSSSRAPFAAATWPLPNVWIGVSVEDRKHGLPRVDVLRKIPAAVRWLSIEPQLEDLGEIDLRGISWVVQGGESGPGARPFDLAWARSIVRQCRDADVPVFMKQLGSRPVGEWGEGKPPTRVVHSVGNLGGPGLVELSRRTNGSWVLTDRTAGAWIDEWPDDLRIRQFPEPRR